MSYAPAPICDVLSGQRFLDPGQEELALTDDLVVGHLDISSFVDTGCTAGASLFGRHQLQNPSSEGANTITVVGLLSNARFVIRDLVPSCGNETFRYAGVLNVGHHYGLVTFPTPEKIHPKNVSTTSLSSRSTPAPLLTWGDLLNARKGLLSSEQYESLGKQLRTLLEDVDDDAAGVQISIVSLDALISFLSKHRPPQPNIALTKHGRFTASWTSGRRSKITLTFDHEGGTWVAVNLDAVPGTTPTGAFVISSLDGISQPYRSWVRP